MGMEVTWSPSVVAKLAAKHGLTTAEANEVLLNDSLPTTLTHKTRRPCRFGYTSTGKYIIVIWEEIDGNPDALRGVSAYEVPPPRKRK